MLQVLTIIPWKLLIGLISFTPIIYWYLTRNYNYWTKQGIPGPKPVLLFGNILDRIKENMADIDVRYLKKYGKVYGLFDGTEPVLQIADPELIKLVLVKEFHRFSNRRELRTEHPVVNKNLFNSRSEDWKKIRTITSSTFTSGKMKKLYGLVRKCLGEYLVHLDELADSDQPQFDAKQMHENLTMDVIACCAFATQTNAVKEPNNAFVVNARKIFDISIFRLICGFVFPKFVNNLLNVKIVFEPEANQWIIDFTKHVIEERQRSGKKNNDFLQLLMDAKADDNKRGEFSEGLSSHYITKDEDSDINVDNTYGNKSLDLVEIMAQSWVFLLAGFETTATTLGYLSYLLAINPEVQEKLYNEVISSVGTDGEFSYEELHRLPYLDACISETLRVFPPVSRLEREVNQDFKLGDSEIKLYKKQLVEIPVYAIHHSEEYFENAEQFIPERFLPENRHKIIPYTYLPFGTGPRNCIGMRFALMEIKLAMSHILMRFRFTKCDKTEDKIKFRPRLPVIAPFSVTVGIENR